MAGWFVAGAALLALAAGAVAAPGDAPAGVAATPQGAGLILLERPGEREFVRDLAGLIGPDDKARIAAVCDKLLTDRATPVLVVTIESMAAHGGSGMRIETFAHLVFDQWQIGHAEIAGKPWNTGILLLVSRDDRRARIQLGAGWSREKDKQCGEIMEGDIIPRFKSGDFSGGIVAGVESLDRMARDLKPPWTKSLPKLSLLHVALAALVVFTIVSLARRGSGGWAWLFWGAAFGLLGAMIYHVFTQSRSSGGGWSGGGSFSGGSFGGGFSGGGGATGSW